MNDQNPTPAYSYPAPARRLVRRRDDRMLGGVCAGLADYLRVDVTLVRVLAFVGACIGMGSLVVAYLVAWLLLPEE